MFEENFQNFNLDSALLRPKDPSLRSVFGPARTKHETAAAPTPANDVVAAARSDVPRPGIYRKPFFLKKSFLVSILLLVLLGLPLVFGARVLGSLGKIFAGRSPLAFFTSFGQLLTADSRHLQGEQDGEVNILLLGIGGEGHDGALLTDTMILATIHKPQADGQGAELSLVSIPRDLVVKLPDGLDWRKINSAYAYGEIGGKKLGSKWAIEAVEGVTGVKVPYYALIDFSGFKRAIDDLGGVDISVERTFNDSEYPDYQHGYLPTIKFEQGAAHMSGERALEFARSRHGTNGEGSDFARSRRQTKILTAVKERVLSLKLRSDLSTISKLLGNFADHFVTNLEPWELKRVYDLTHSIPPSSILNLSLDPATGLLCNDIDPGTGAYILTRCPGVSEKQVYAFIADKFTHAKLLREASTLAIQNSTKLTGLAQRVAEGLRMYYMQAESSNYPSKDVLKDTTVYDLTGGKKPETLKYLQARLNALTSSTYPYPLDLPLPKPDFVVVLGTDATTFSTSTPETK